MDFIMFERQGKTPKLQIVEADKAVSIPEDAVSFTYVSGNERLENGSYKYVKYAIGYPVKIFMGGLHYGLNGYQVHSGSYNDKYYLYSNGSGVQMIHAIDSNVNLVSDFEELQLAFNSKLDRKMPDAVDYCYKVEDVAWVAAHAFTDVHHGNAITDQEYALRCEMMKYYEPALEQVRERIAAMPDFKTWTYENQINYAASTMVELGDPKNAGTQLKKF